MTDISRELSATKKLKEDFGRLWMLFESLKKLFLSSWEVVYGSVIVLTTIDIIYLKQFLKKYFQLQKVRQTLSVFA